MKQMIKNYKFVLRTTRILIPKIVQIDSVVFTFLWTWSEKFLAWHSAIFFPVNLISQWMYFIHFIQYFKLLNDDEMGLC